MTLGARRNRPVVVWLAPVLLIASAFGLDKATRLSERAIPGHRPLLSAPAPARSVAGMVVGPKLAASPSLLPAVSTRAKPLSGKVIAVDPGHNGGDWTAPSVINRLVWNGREYETCDTAGTETGSGYTEARFNWNVARFLAADLKAEGAKVVLTRNSNSGVGPCVTARAAIANHARANAAISIHADGGPPTGRGFFILEPVADGPNDAVITPSKVLGNDIRAAFMAATKEPTSTYFGITGIHTSDDLAALNLTTVPKVLIECANMRNATDAALVTTAAWQRKAAEGLAAGLVAFIDGPPSHGHKRLIGPHASTARTVLPVPPTVK